MEQTIRSIVLLVGTASDANLLKQLATRLQRDGIDARVGTPASGTNDPAAPLRENLEAANTLVVATSPSLLQTDWPWLEQASLPFRDSREGIRRFVPLSLEECVLPETARRFRAIRWRPGEEESGYTQLLLACGRELLPVSGHDQTVQASAVTEKILKGHSKEVWCITISGDGERVATGGGDGLVKVWHAANGTCLTTFDHGYPVYAAVCSREGNRVISAGADGKIKVWDVGCTGSPIELTKHRDLIYALALAADDRTLVSGSGDRTVRVWDIESGKCVNTLKGHADEVCAVAIAPDGQRAISGSVDGSIRVWGLAQGKCQKILRGHTERVCRIVVFQQGGRMATGSNDGTVRIWDLTSGRCVATIEGHPGRVVAIAALLGGSVVAAASACTQTSPSLVKLWDAENGACLATISQGVGDYPYDAEDAAFYSLCFSRLGDRLLVGCESGAVVNMDLASLGLAQKLSVSRPEVRYTNAKVVLVGESGVGKSGLAVRLAESRWQQTESTHGMQIWPLKYPGLGGPDMEREVWLWDLAGQPEYRLIHQLFLDETSLALVLYDSARPDDPMYGIGHWEEALRVAVGVQLPKLLVAARIDRGGPRLTSEKIGAFCSQHGYQHHTQTSAKTGEGCDALRQAILDSIPWDRLPWTATTRLFKTLQNAVVHLRNEGILLLRHAELHQQMRLLHPEEAFGEAELRAVVGLMAGQGLVKKLSFGDFVLLQPEQINNYGAAVIRAARRHQDGIGCIKEDAVLSGTFDMQDLQRVNRGDESFLLRALVQHFIDQSLCIKEPTADGDQLVFPSQFNREMPDAPAPPPCSGAYRFRGQVETVFTTLVVRLTYKLPVFRRAIFGRMRLHSLLRRAD